MVWRQLGVASTKGRATWLLALVVLALLLLPFLAGPLASGPSVESRTSDGLLGARRVLESWGTEVQRVEVASVQDLEQLVWPTTQPGPTHTGPTHTDWETTDQAKIDELKVPSTLFVAFPAQQVVLNTAEPLDRWVREGGSLVVSYSGELAAFAEQGFLAEFGVTTMSSNSQVSLLPWRFWRRTRAGDRHVLVPPVGVEQNAAAADKELVSDPLNMLVSGSACVSAVRGSESSTEVGRVLDGAGEHNRTAVENGRSAAKADSPGHSPAAVLRCEHGEGVLWLLPTSVLANSRISNVGNLELLWRLREDLPGSWAVLEGALRMTIPAEAADRVRNARSTLNLMGLQLGLLYLGSVLALAWSFGPRWSERRLPPEGHRRFLLGLGALHENLGGLASAAELLKERWLDYDPMARGRHQETQKNEAAETQLAEGSQVPTDSGALEMSSEELVRWARTYSRPSAGNAP